MKSKTRLDVLLKPLSRMLRNSILKLIGHSDGGYMILFAPTNNNSLYGIARTLGKLC
ncbi:hypothetical protein EMIT0P100_40295 [Pseudomonas sp. IT-P100]